MFLDVSSPKSWIPYSEWLRIAGHSSSGFRKVESSSRSEALYHALIHCRNKLVVMESKRSGGGSGEGDGGGEGGGSGRGEGVESVGVNQYSEEDRRTRLDCYSWLKFVAEELGPLAVTKEDRRDLAKALCFGVGYLTFPIGNSIIRTGIFPQSFSLLEKWGGIEPAIGINRERNRFRVALGVLAHKIQLRQVSSSDIIEALTIGATYHGTHGGCEAYEAMARLLSEHVLLKHSELLLLRNEVGIVLVMWIASARSYGRINSHLLWEAKGILPLLGWSFPHLNTSPSRCLKTFADCYLRNSGCRGVGYLS